MGGPPVVEYHPGSAGGFVGISMLRSEQTSNTMAFPEAPLDLHGCTRPPTAPILREQLPGSMRHDSHAVPMGPAMHGSWDVWSSLVAPAVSRSPAPGDAKFVAHVPPMSAWGGSSLAQDLVAAPPPPTLLRR